MLPGLADVDERIIAWLNFLVLIISSIIFTIYYLKSVKPESLSQEIGPGAYEKCKWYRIVAGVFMTVACANYHVYSHYPLPFLHDWIPQTFPWPYRISVVLASLIAIPFAALMCIGMYDAGEETMTPKKKHAMFTTGIYEHMRHPQAVGEFPLWWVAAFLAHSPFLVLFSFLYLPIWYW